VNCNREDSWSPEADAASLAYLDALDTGDLASARAIRDRWRDWPGVIRALDELLDGVIQETR
jgi:hypothetical protein